MADWGKVADEVVVVKGSPSGPEGEIAVSPLPGTSQWDPPRRLKAVTKSSTGMALTVKGTELGSTGPEAAPPIKLLRLFLALWR